ncbi:MAG: YsnF/AvaK domain-containing protein [Bacillus sp. (in: firmicutes)]
MNKTVYGVYETSPEVVQAINGLKAKGYDSDDITIVTDEANRLLEVDTAGAEVKTVSDDDSFMDKVKKFFSLELDEGVDSTLDGYGLTGREKDEYLTDINNGRILVFVDDLSDNDVLDTTAATTPVDPHLGGNRITPADSGLNDTSNAPFTGRAADGLEDEKTLRLREEQLQVDKDQVQTGEVVVNKQVRTEQKEVQVPVEHEEVYIERRPVTNPTAGINDGSITDENETIRIPVVEEQLQVTKKPVVTDEIVIGKEKVQETKTVKDSVKKEDVSVDKNGNPILSDDTVTAADRKAANMDSSYDYDDKEETTDPYLKNRINTDNL